MQEPPDARVPPDHSWPPHSPQEHQFGHSKQQEPAQGTLQRQVTAHGEVTSSTTRGHTQLSLVTLLNENHNGKGEKQQQF